MCVKCADLGHCAAPASLHRNWVACLESEFIEQGRLEAAAGLPISPLMDKDMPLMSDPGNQVSFMDAVVLPMYRAMSDVFPSTRPLLDLAQANRNLWASGDMLRPSAAALKP
jgi:hypothetical protein